MPPARHLRTACQLPQCRACTRAGACICKAGHAAQAGDHPKVAAMKERVQQRTKQQEADESSAKAQLAEKANQHLESFYQVRHACRYMLHCTLHCPTPAGQTSLHMLMSIPGRWNAIRSSSKPGQNQDWEDCTLYLLAKSPLSKIHPAVYVVWLCCPQHYMLHACLPDSPCLSQRSHCWLP